MQDARRQKRAGAPDLTAAASLVAAFAVVAAAASRSARLHDGRAPGFPPGRAAERSPDQALADEADERGRDAETPTEIPRRGWKDIVIRVYGQLAEDRLLAVAAGVTFYALLAIFPALVALVSLYGLTADLGSLNEHLESFAGIVPRAGLDFIGDQVIRIVQKSDGTLGLAFVAGLATALWSANAGVKAMFDALNVVYEEREKRSFIMLNLTSLVFTAGAIVFILLAFNAVVILPIALDFVGLGRMTETLISLGRWPLLFAAVLFALALLYRYGPSRRPAKWRWTTTGSLAAGALWIVGSIAFSWYAENLATYNETYGSLGAAIGFMTWIWMSVIVVMLGGELNAEMEHQTAEDTTAGAPKPLGLRGARIADTVAG